MTDKTASTIGYDRLFELQERKAKQDSRASAAQSKAPAAAPAASTSVAVAPPSSRALITKPKRHTTFHLTVEAHQILEEMALTLRRLADDQGLTRPNKSVLVEALIREAAEHATTDPQRVLSWYLDRRQEMGGSGDEDAPAS